MNGTSPLDLLAKKLELNRDDLTMPHVEACQVVGLFGGSFNPPHQGHGLVAETALRKLGLDQLWWMVTPGNPLKDLSVLAPLASRLNASRAMIHDPRIKVTAFEAAIDTRYSADTIQQIMQRNPNVKFVWLMGADNLKSFHLWQDWQNIVAMLPIAVIDRPGATLSYLSSKMAQRFSYARVDEDDASILGHLPAPAWTFIHGPRSSLSSSAIRAGKTPLITK